MARRQYVLERFSKIALDEDVVMAQRKKAPYRQNDVAIFSGDRTKNYFFSFCCPFSFCHFVQTAFCCNVVAAEIAPSLCRLVVMARRQNEMAQISHHAIGFDPKN